MTFRDPIRAARQEQRPGVGKTRLLACGTRFRLFEQVVALVVDDLQWADVASLELFRHLTAWLPRGVVVVGALRDRAPTPGSEPARTPASASRSQDHRPAAPLRP
ncbi:hypothetical protein [Herbidospora daliensis]|uniref:hypothetical protein n=1 Tax=Herbidospora daliensis TaxID=295585 RepID=UPI000785B097|nr:hypothetical protein [Herbidospora daliensis]